MFLEETSMIASSITTAITCAWTDTGLYCYIAIVKEIPSSTSHNGSFLSPLHLILNFGLSWYMECTTWLVRTLSHCTLQVRLPIGNLMQLSFGSWMGPSFKNKMGPAASKLHHNNNGGNHSFNMRNGDVFNVFILNNPRPWRCENQAFTITTQDVLCYIICSLHSHLSFKL